MTHPPMPTADQCNEGARVEDFEGSPAYAAWYPQMGGYVGKAVVVIVPDGNLAYGDGPCHDRCFEAYVWHDGEFPFSEGDDWSGRGPVRYLHHCMPSQFIDFGEFVIAKQKEHP